MILETSVFLLIIKMIPELFLHPESATVHRELIDEQQTGLNSNPVPIGFFPSSCQRRRWWRRLVTPPLWFVGGWQCFRQVLVAVVLQAWPESCRRRHTWYVCNRCALQPECNSEHSAGCTCQSGSRVRLCVSGFGAGPAWLWLEEKMSGKENKINDHNH